MGQPAAKKGDQVVATDTHIVMSRRPAAPFRRRCRTRSSGSSTARLASDVNIEGKPAAVEGSTATNVPWHVPAGGPVPDDRRPTRGRSSWAARRC